MSVFVRGGTICERHTIKTGDDISRSATAVLDTLALLVDLQVDASAGNCRSQEVLWQGCIGRVLESSAFAELFGKSSSTAKSVTRDRVSARSARAFGRSCGVDVDRVQGAIVTAAFAREQRQRWSIDAESVLVARVIMKEIEDLRLSLRAQGPRDRAETSNSIRPASAEYADAIDRLGELGQLERALGPTVLPDL